MGPKDFVRKDFHGPCRTHPLFCFTRVECDCVPAGLPQALWRGAEARAGHTCLLRTAGTRGEGSSTEELVEGEKAKRGTAPARAGLRGERCAKGFLGCGSGR